MRRNNKKALYEKIMRNVAYEVKRVLESESFMASNDNDWCVIFTGGSVGTQHLNRYGSKRCTIDEEGLTELEAIEAARRANMLLSKGEKKYYKMRYYAVKRCNVK